MNDDNINTEFKAALQFDRTLAVGQSVEVRWTNNHNYYRSRGTVVKVNDKSARVKLEQEILDYTRRVVYEKGREIRAPRCKFGAMLDWSFNNGIFPIKE